MEVTLIGAAPLSRDSETLALTSLSSAQARLIFSRLAVEAPRPVPSDELANCLWPHHLPRTWRATLRGVIARVRRWLSDAGLDPLSTLEATSRGYRLCLPDSWSIDVLDAIDALGAAEDLLRSGDHSSAAAAARRAGELTALEFLPDHDGDWTNIARRRFRNIHSRALEIESDASMAAGHNTEALSAVRRLVAAEPFSETARQRLMHLLNSSGDRSGALAVYDEFASLLMADLGVAPSIATRSLQLQILDERQDDSPRSRPFTREDLAVRVFVGRTAEMERIDDAWQNARSGHVTLMVIAGEAGIGKTSLAVHAAKRYHDEGATVLFGRCTVNPTLPFEPFVEMLESHAEMCSSDDRDRLLAAGGRDLSWAVPSLSPREGGFPDAPITEPDQRRPRDAVSRCIRDLADTGPAVLLIDDVQWATKTSLSMLLHVVNRLRNSPVLVLLMERRNRGCTTQGDLRAALAELHRERGLDEIVLAGLESAEAAALARTSAFAPNAAPIGAVHAEALRVYCGGNPFFMVELLRTGHGLLDEARDGGAVPARVIDVIEHQCSAVGHDANTVLRALAVTGASSEWQLLQHVTNLDDDAFLDAVDEARSSGLVIPSSRHPEHLAYAHALAEEAVCSLIPAAVAARLHRRAGEGLEALRLGGVNVSTAEVARHLTLARTSGTAKRATAYILEAAVADLNAGERENAIERLQAALAEAPDAHARCQILLLLGRASQEHGDGLESRRSFLEAARLAGSDVGDRNVLSEAALGLNVGGRGVSSWEPDPVRIALLEAALAQDRPDSPALQVKVMAALSETITTSDGWTRRQQLADEAMAIAAGSSSAEVTIAALDASRIAWWKPNQAPARIGYVDRVLGLLDDHDQATALRGMLMRLADLVTLGDREAADAALAMMWPAARSLGQIRFIWELSLWEAGFALNDGRLNEAAARAEQAAAVWGEADHPDAQRALREQTGLRLLLTGDASQVLGGLQQPSAIPQAASSTYRCVLPFALVLEGRHGEASSMLDDFAANDYRDLPQHSNWLFSAAMLSEAAAAVGSATAVEGLQRLLAPHAGSMVLLDGPQITWGCVDHHLGALAARTEDDAESVDRLRAALAQHRAFGSRPWEAKTSVLLGGRLLGASVPGAHEEGDALLAEGARTAEAIGLTRLASAARSIARRGRPIDFRDRHRQRTNRDALPKPTAFDPQDLHAITTNVDRL